MSRKCPAQAAALRREAAKALRLPDPRAECRGAWRENAPAPRRRRAWRRRRAAPAGRNFFQPRGKIGDEALLAAEQMRRAFDVEEKTVGAVLLVPRRGGRRIARRPQRKPAQRRIVGGGVDGAHLQKSRFRPRIGQRLAGRKTCGFRRFVQGGDARPAGSGHGQDERPVRRNGFLRGVLRGFCLRREHAQDRPAWQPN